MNIINLIIINNFYLTDENKKWSLDKLMLQHYSKTDFQTDVWTMQHRHQTEI